ncbi:MAG TPA: sialate O-acetylesterase [Pirellulaceae bacterium]
MEKDEKYQPLIARWEQTEKTYDAAKAKASYEEAVAKAKAAGKAAPRSPGNPLTGNARPGNIYNGVLKPTVGYGIRGVIWYQGESNAGRAYQYRDLFPLMIKSWRDEWNIGDFSFYWVQLADFLPEKTEPGDSTWPELREAQTMTMAKLPNTGEAVIIDLGEARDIHPRNKQDVAKRLARWALNRDYGMSNIPYHSPQYKSMEKQGNKVILSFDHIGAGLYTFDTTSPVGFAIAGEDKKFVWADAKLLGTNNVFDKIEVSSDKITDPASVRYAWADNPICNVYSKEGLPLTPFRTDDWKGATADAR